MAAKHGKRKSKCGCYAFCRNKKKAAKNGDRPGKTVKQTKACKEY